MSMPRAMCFIDGENIVMRYQAMLEEGRSPNAKVIHEKDCFLWHPQITMWSMFNFVRVNYYTSATGDAPRIEALKKTIAEVEYRSTYTHEDGVPEATAQLVPHVFHKPSKNTKTRNVDLQISIDVLRAAHLSNIDLIYILSGDGDYVPLIQEVSRYGKEVWVGAFNSGLSPKLQYNVDVFQPLDDFFFKKQRKSRSVPSSKPA